MKWLVLVVALAACSRPKADSTPEGALDQFLEACEQSARDPAATARAIALMVPASRKALEQKSQRATAMIGRPLTPEQILIAGFTPLRFEIVKTTTTIDEQGMHAYVDITGPDPTTQHARVPMEREGTAWRVAVTL